MKVPTRPNHPDIKLAYQEKLDERESWHKLVIKIISWREGVLEGATFRAKDKITYKEWVTYYQRTLKTNITHSRERVLADLRHTKSMIKEHGGFEDSSIPAKK